jgi:hypothetical protein
MSGTYSSFRIIPGQLGTASSPILAGESGLIGNGIPSPFIVTIDVDKSQMMLSQIA